MLKTPNDFPNDLMLKSSLMISSLKLGKKSTWSTTPYMPWPWVTPSLTLTGFILPRWLSWCSLTKAGQFSPPASILYVWDALSPFHLLHLVGFLSDVILLERLSLIPYLKYHPYLCPFIFLQNLLLSWDYVNSIITPTLNERSIRKVLCSLWHVQGRQLSLVYLINTNWKE